MDEVEKFSVEKPHLPGPRPSQLRLHHPQLGDVAVHLWGSSGECSIDKIDDAASRPLPVVVFPSDHHHRDCAATLRSEVTKAHATCLPQEAYGPMRPCVLLPRPW